VMTIDQQNAARDAADDRLDFRRHAWESA
jgi:hypothetical protein